MRRGDAQFGRQGTLSVVFLSRLISRSSLAEATPSYDLSGWRYRFLATASAAGEYTFIGHPKGDKVGKVLQIPDQLIDRLQRRPSHRAIRCATAHCTVGNGQTRLLIVALVIEKRDATLSQRRVRISPVGSGARKHQGRTGRPRIDQPWEPRRNLLPKVGDAGNLVARICA